MKNYRTHLYLGISSLYIFFLFLLISRLIYSNEFPSYEYTIWLGQQSFLVQVAVWFPLVVAVIMFADAIYRFIKEYNKRPTQ